MKPRGFTVVELLVVATVMGILAVSVVPAFTQVTEARRGAARREIERRLVEARELAMSTGTPAGVRVTVSSSAFQPLIVGSAGIQPATDSLGQAAPEWHLAESYRGVRLTACVHTDGSAGDGVIWFGLDGTPQRRSAAGALIGPATSDASVEITGGGTIWVRRGSGLVER